MRVSRAITSLHVDDEPDTVETIGEELYYRAKGSFAWKVVDDVTPNWTRSEDRTRQELVIVLRGSTGNDCTITYKIVFDYAIAKTDVDSLAPHDIAIFDLMHNPGNESTIDDGYKLWKLATERLPDRNRVFILTAFPLALKRSPVSSDIPPRQLLSKPISPAKVVDKIIEILGLHELH
jgi:hypothetical protein